MSKTDQGNPEIGMSEESIDAAAQEETQQVPTGSVESVFDQLENQVNVKQMEQDEAIKQLAEGIEVLNRQAQDIDQRSAANAAAQFSEH